MKTQPEIQLKSKPCISGEYVGMMVLVTRAIGVFGVAPVLDLDWFTQFLPVH